MCAKRKVKENLKDKKRRFTNKPRIKTLDKEAKEVKKVNKVDKVDKVDKVGELREVEKVNKIRKTENTVDRYKELPNVYNDTKIVIIPRDPYWIYAYWEINNESIENMKLILREEFFGSKSILRVYDVTDVEFNGKNFNKYFDITLEGLANNWYINVGEPERSWCVDIGMITPSGEFYVFVRSNTIKTPSNKISNVIDEEWSMSEEEMQRIYMMEDLMRGTGSEFLSKRIFKRLQQQISSGAVSSISSPAGRVKKPSAFGLRVGTELIVYGATEPTASVTVNKKPVALREDGTFSLRFNLLDGNHIIDVEGVSANQQHKESYTIVVGQSTRKSGKS